MASGRGPAVARARCSTNAGSIPSGSVERPAASPHQDSLFPTACYVAGPSELAYLAQLGRVYDAFGIPMPLIQSRATATIVDSNAMRFLNRHEFPFESLRAQDEAALNTLLESQLPPRIEALLQDTSSAVEDRLGQLATAITELDATLEGATRSTLGRVQDDLKKLHGKVIQAAKGKRDVRRQYTTFSAGFSGRLRRNARRLHLLLTNTDGLATG